ncbi:Gfo/Idh/MocA family oxidoreductase [Streptomyces sp. NPDC005355]|uniref:Gfo/Idh/MocA family oxidoreductase n=1 Tax=Streptomyces sp. NPDC005355 TaxID=3157038 RepID=UPI0033AF17D7
MVVGVVGAGIADLDPTRARSQAERYNTSCVPSPDELLARRDFELVVNLTIPAAHARVAMAAVSRGKHVWGGKPLTLDRESARDSATRRRC